VIVKDVLTHFGTAQTMLFENAPVLEMGYHEFPFSFRLPSSILPSTYEVIFPGQFYADSLRILNEVLMPGLVMKCPS
jgi:hypothetical protein